MTNTEQQAPEDWIGPESEYVDLSLSSYFVVPRFGETVLSPAATAFFVVREGDLYLITNWHVVSGRNSETGECLLTSGGIPDNLLVRLHRDTEFVEHDSVEVRIVDEDGRPLWIEHPRGRSVDVVALKMTLPLGLIAKPIDGLMEPFNENLKVAIADDVFVIGYPFGLSAGEFFPIWKRATIASEPRVEIAGLPKMLVDTASRPGMSGSPVVVYRRRPVTLIGPSPSDPARRVMSRHETRLVGIYSGRIGNEDPEFKAQLGVVWKARVIDEILSGDARIYVQT